MSRSLHVSCFDESFDFPDVNETKLMEELACLNNPTEFDVDFVILNDMANDSIFIQTVYTNLEINGVIQEYPLIYSVEFNNGMKMHHINAVPFEFMSAWFCGFLKEDFRWANAVNWNINSPGVCSNVTNDFDQVGYQEKIKLLKDIAIALPITETDGHGVVYLLKAGPFYKIGKSIDGQRRCDQITLQLPYSVELLHMISTDDIHGIETYWHRRFIDKRANGEWFLLSDNDVILFKSRTSM